jgi:4-hydroxy-tetrahydrodipicolinate synthase
MLHVRVGYVEAQFKLFNSWYAEWSKQPAVARKLAA